MRSWPLFELSIIKCTVLLNSQATYYDFTVPFCVFKVPAARDPAYFAWPIYTDSYCSSCNYLTFLQMRRRTVVTFY
jgi:hypothetical protein